jgi:hypothetical protein
VEVQLVEEVEDTSQTCHGRQMKVRREVI